MAERTANPTTMRDRLIQQIPCSCEEKRNDGKHYIDCLRGQISFYIACLEGNILSLNNNGDADGKIRDSKFREQYKKLLEAGNAMAEAILADSPDVKMTTLNWLIAANGKHVVFTSSHKGSKGVKGK